MTDYNDAKNESSGNGYGKNEIDTRMISFH